MADSPFPQASSPASEITGWMAGEYRLGRKLGEGGFGAVYEAVHPLLKRRAAVKVLHRNAGSDSDAVLRFVAEARAVNQIRNRHIIDIFSFGKLPDGRHFYVMDLLEGEPLDRYIAREGRCTVDQTIQLLRPIAEALDAAHAAGIVHRDLKPQNIYLVWDASGETVPKLLDFGMAKLLGDSRVHTVSGTPLGTPLYMSPEQARGDAVDGRSDVYALGVLCHELLTGSLPISGENTIAVLMAHIIQTPPRVSEVCADLPSELDAPVLRMLEKKPELRPRTASEALSDLACAAERSGLSVPPGSPRLSRPMPHEPGAAAHSEATADTTLQALSPARLLLSDPDFGRDAMERTTEPSPARRFPRWPTWLLLIAIGAAATLFFAHNRGATPGAPASASARLAAPPQAQPPPLPSSADLPPTTNSSPNPNPSPSAIIAAPPPTAPKLMRRLPAAASAPARVPSDLESPF